jgi:hypothetical protein
VTEAAITARAELDTDSQHKERAESRPSRSTLRRFFWENSLSLVLVTLFLGTMVGQVLAGLPAYNEEQKEHGQPTVTLGEYLSTGHFVEATAENWESEFLQMAMFVILTVFLRQKGSAESKQPYGEEDVDEDPRKHENDPEAPGPVKAGGAVLWVYKNSLFLTFLFLFLFSFLVHAWGGARLHSEEQIAHGQPAVSMAQYMATSQFWFESMQNWQSEFLSLAAMVILTIWLRQHGSPESKPVHHSHARTASE